MTTDKKDDAETEESGQAETVSGSPSSSTSASSSSMTNRSKSSSSESTNSESNSSESSSSATSTTAAAAPVVSAKSSAGAAAADKPPVAKAVKPRTPKWLLFLLLLIIAALAALAYCGWSELRNYQAAQAQLTAKLEQQERHWQDVQQRIGQLGNRQQQELAGWAESLQGVDRRLEEHSRRLKSLSTTTREDWLLAEAEYLLRLANQRLQMERGTIGALGLLQAADQILHQLDDSELFGVRDTLARDIAALKLAPNIDRSGLYLRLAALAENIEALPELPRLEATAPAETNERPQAQAAEQPPVGFAAAVQAHFWSAMDQLKHQVRIRHSDQPLQPLLPPDGARYLRQNIRFNLEQAQLAMLREEDAIYRHSLQQAEGLLRQYFALQPAAQIIADQLQELAQADIVVKLPSISASLTALQEYIDKLHLLDEQAGRPQLQPTEAQ